MAEKYITKIRTSEGDLQIDYNALANLPDVSNIIDEHAGDTVVHITAEERAEWNSKAPAIAYGTTEVTTGSVSPYPNGTLYVVIE